MSVGGKILIVAEKPSVGADIARVLRVKGKGQGCRIGNRYIVTWCIGHLIELAPPSDYGRQYKKWDIDSLPVAPWRFKTLVSEHTKQQYQVVSQLMLSEDVLGVICATDAGREGELIFRLVYNQCGCTKPVKRLWISSMTDQAIIEGFKSLKPMEEYDNLYYSAFARAKADWLVGMNATRLFTISNNKKDARFGERQMLSVGRVQTPTLALVTKRYLAIKDFKPEKYYRLEALFEEGFKALWNDGEKIKKLEDAQALLEQCKGKPATVTEVTSKQRSQERPFLFDLTELQREANVKFGYTAAKTLECAQSLYEKHKLITYPRTDSRFLTKDVGKTLPGLISRIAANEEFDLVKIPEDFVPNVDKRIVDDKKVSDHHAIIPTDKLCKGGIRGLSEPERNVLFLVMARLIVSLSQKYVYMETVVKLLIGEQPFSATGRAVKQGGWKAVQAAIFGDEKTEKTLPKLRKGQVLPPPELNVAEKETTPPKAYNDATLLSAMEHAGQNIEDEMLREQMKGKGLGTPSTRASIIETLIKRGYVVREKKNIMPTERGLMLIDVMYESLKSPELTAKWEARLGDIAAGVEEHDLFMKDIKTYVTEMIRKGRKEIK